MKNTHNSGNQSGMDMVLQHNTAQVYGAILDFFAMQSATEASEQLLDCLQYAIGNTEFESGPQGAEIMDTVRRICKLLQHLQPEESRQTKQIV